MLKANFFCASCAASKRRQDEGVAAMSSSGLCPGDEGDVSESELVHTVSKERLAEYDRLMEKGGIYAVVSAGPLNACLKAREDDQE